MSNMTITVPTAPGKVVFFDIGFENSDFDKVIKAAESLNKPSDVKLAEEKGIWKIID